MNHNLTWHKTTVTQQQRETLLNQKGVILWFTGLSGSGKSTLANVLSHRLHEMGHLTMLLDGDNVRLGLNRDLGFSAEDREENIRRIGEVAALFVESGVIVLSAFISPFQKDRDKIRTLVDPGRFVEIFVDAGLETCEARDPKGLYQKARAGVISDFTGISSPYEAPENPELQLKNVNESDIDENVNQIILYLEEAGVLHGHV